jgi:hypothetical protein
VLVDEGHLDGLADDHPLSGCSAGDQLEQRRFTGAVGADDADDGARRDVEAQVVDQQAVARLADVLELDDLLPRRSATE